MSEKFTMTPTGHEGAHKLEHEFVPNREKAKEIYIRLDDERIAYRGKPGTPQARTWLSMKEGYRVEDLDDSHIVVWFGDERIN